LRLPAGGAVAAGCPAVDAATGVAANVDRAVVVHGVAGAGAVISCGGDVEALIPDRPVGAVLAGLLGVLRTRA